MARSFAHVNKSVLLLVDVQPKFLRVIHEGNRVVTKSEFLAKVSKLLSVPVLATEQNPERMGPTADSLIPYLVELAAPKMTFSCSGCAMFQRHFVGKPPMQVVIAGIETHICVSQTTHELLDLGHEVILAADAISARTPDRHEIGLTRLRDAGAVVAHSESIVYEWMQSASNPAFRDVLELVKAVD